MPQLTQRVAGSQALAAVGRRTFAGLGLLALSLPALFFLTFFSRATPSPIRILCQEPVGSREEGRDIKNLSESKSTQALQSKQGAPHNWTFYKEFNEDLQKMSLQEAEAHYWTTGQFEGRITVPFALRLKYAACGGLCNQLYSHIPAFIMAQALGGGVVLPPAIHRRSYSDRPGDSAYIWSFAPIEGLLDVDRMIEHWAARGMPIYRTPPIKYYPNIPQSYAYHGDLRYELPPEDRCLATSHVANIRPDNLDKWVREAKHAISEAARPILQGGPHNQLPCVYLDTGCTFLQVETNAMLDKAREAAQGIFFNKTLEALANKVISSIDPDGQGFNGLHLRLERDGNDWHKMFGGEENFLKEHWNGMRNLSFSKSSVLYVASGLLTYNASDEVSRVRNAIMEQNFAKDFTYKEQLLPQSVLSGLSSEQSALVDFLVLRKAAKIVGCGFSTFSYMLRELRAVDGHPKDSVYLVALPGETYELFRRAADFSRRLQQKPFG